MNIKRLYGTYLKVLTKLFGIDAAKCFDARFRQHTKINLKTPTTLADKACYIELHCQSDMASTCTDKFAVREYISSKGYGDTLVPLAGGPWMSAEDVNFAELPDSFAIKATHGCKMNCIVPDKSKLDVDKCRNDMRRWLATTYGTYSLETHYYGIKPRLYAEKYLDNTENLVDYKFHCMNGKPEFVLTCSDRKTNGDKGMGVTLNLFDMEWNSLSGLKADKLEVPGDGSLAKPTKFEEMKKMATDLAADFKFVRVDLYELDGKIYFGELTFSPGSCVFPYFTEEFQKEAGRKLTI